MKKPLLLLLLAIATFLGCSRKSYPESSMSSIRIDEHFEARLLESASGALPYRVAHINPDSLTGKPWLVLYLHSANGRGTDNVAQFQRQKASTIPGPVSSRSRRSAWIGCLGMSGNNLCCPILLKTDSLSFTTNFPLSLYLL